MLPVSQQSVLSIHLGSSTKDPHCPDVETALGVFTFHGRLSVHLQHKDVSFRHALTKLTLHPSMFTFFLFFFFLSLHRLLLLFSRRGVENT